MTRFTVDGARPFVSSPPRQLRSSDSVISVTGFDNSVSDKW